MSKGKPISKRARTLILACVAVLVLGGALTVLLLIPPKEETASSEETTSEPEITLVDKTKDAQGKTVDNPVKSMTIKLQNEEIVFSADKDGALRADKYKDLTAHTSNLSALANQMANIVATKDLGAVEKPEDFGFDKPAAVINATYHDGSTYSCELGSETPLGDGYYMRAAAGGNVYIVTTGVGETFTAASTTYIDTTLMTAPTAKEGDAEGRAVLRDMALSGTVRESKPFAFQMVTTADEDKAFSLFTYKMTTPYLRGVNSDKISTLQSYTSLVADSVVKAYPTKEDLTKYGFDKPYSVAKLHTAVTSTESSTSSAASSGEEEDAKTIFYNVTETTVKVGGKDEDGNYYVMVNDTPVIYLVAPSSISAWVDVQYDDLADALLFMQDITTVQSISLTMNGQKTTFQLTHYPDKEDADDKLVVKAGDKTLGTESFRNLYQVMMSVSRYGPADKKPTGEPAVVFELTNVGESKPSVVAKLYKNDASLYTCVQNTGETYQVRASLVNKLETKLNDYLAGKEITTD